MSRSRSLYPTWRKNDATNPRAWLDKPDLFENQPYGSEKLSPAGKAKIDEAMAEFGDGAFGRAIIVDGYSPTGDTGAQFATSLARATLVRHYLQARFGLDSRDVGIVPLRGVPPPSTNKKNWDGICLVLLKPRASAR
jgi:phospholipid/cholesterol/gamma-HCH transport system substrate-binding protein